MDKVITDSQWARAIATVDNRLSSLGLFTRALNEDVSVFYGGAFSELYRTFQRADGFFIPWANSIHLPNRWLSRYLSLRASASPRFTYCHEVGHALAENHWGLVLGNPQFRTAFGNSYRGKRKWAEDPDDYVTGYAMESPAEDFAETFASWVINLGRPQCKMTRRLKAKYAFISMMPRRIRSLGIELA